MSEILSRLEAGQPITVAEMAELLRCSKGYVYKLIGTKALAAGRVGSDYRIPAEEALRVRREAGF